MKCILKLAALALCLGPPLFASEAKPNIIVIFADDLGWGSAGSYGADPELLQTPAIDRIASEGRRFTDAYVASSVCTPSRYALLTGRYSWRGRLKHAVIKFQDPLLIEDARPTLASMLKQQGYHTAVIGKWHLGFGTSRPVDYTAPLKPGPLEVGFDYFYGLAANHSDATGVYLDTVSDATGESIVVVEGLHSARLEPFGRNAYGRKFLGIDAPQRVDVEVMPRFTEKCIEWIEAQRHSEQPFFLYYAPVSAHSPSTPSDHTEGTSKAGVYGDWIHELDRSVGQLLDALDRMEIADNTLLVFTSDNGGEDRNFARDELKAIASGLKLNGHLRAGKQSIYEGGMRVPFIVRWPGKIPAASVSNEAISMVDLFASFASLTGAELPPVDVGAEDSHNILPSFFDEKSSAPLRPAIVGHSGWGVFSIRQGPWKWIEGKSSMTNRPMGSNVQLVPQLYNLADDPSEQRNVLSDHPEIAAELSVLLETWREQGHSRP